jgi:transposase-like protein
MPQIQLPIFPHGVTPISTELAFECRDGNVYYFNGHLPVFVHAKEDLATFRYFSSQLVINGSVTQTQIANAFGVPLVTVKRCVKRYRQSGGKAFFAPPKRREGHRITEAMIAKVQTLLDAGYEVPEVGRRTGILANTLHKAISAGRLRPCVSKKKRRRRAPRVPNQE